jgi:hypothetical protein
VTASSGGAARRAGPVVLGALVAAVAVAAVVRWTGETRVSLRRASASQAADALPVYLGIATARRGGNPTRAPDLAGAYEAERLQVPASHFSTLYPASTPTLLRPLAPRGWERFVGGWRSVLLASAVVAGVAGAASGAPLRRAWIAAPIGAAAATALFPVVEEAVRLGQMNVLLAALAGLAQLALSVGGAAAASVLLVVGGGLKLVPALALWPVLLGGRRAACVAAVAAGGGVLLATSQVVPLADAARAVAETMRFESAAGARPGLAVDPSSPVWAITLVRARHVPLGMLTAVVTGVAAWRAAERPEARAEVLPGAVALVFCWLAADASGQHALYLPLLLASLAWAVVWPLAPQAPSAAWLAPLLVVPFAYPHAGGWPPERVGLLGAFATWCVIAGRVLRAAGPLARRDRGVLVGALVVSVAVGARPSPDAALGGGPPPDRIVPATAPRRGR